MSEFKLEPKALESALRFALIGTTEFLEVEVIKNTPRDQERLPQNINRKDGLAPHRSTYYKPTKIGGNWYAGVSGKLKQSIAHEEVSQFEQKIGVSIGTANEYARYLEFGTRRMRPRSFLRKAIIDNKRQALAYFQKIFKSKIG